MVLSWKQKECLTKQSSKNSKCAIEFISDDVIEICLKLSYFDFKFSYGLKAHLKIGTC